MNIVLLNWGKGENNPFTYFNQELSKKLIKFGADVSLVELDSGLVLNLYEIYNKKKIDLVITHQGFGTDYKINQTDELIWDRLQIKIISLGSDHPCHNPNLNNADSKYVLHTYCISAYADYANKYLKKINKSCFVGAPNIFDHQDVVDLPKAGDYFVFPKNIDDIASTFKRWRASYKPEISSLLESISEDVMCEYGSSVPFDHHDLIESSLGVRTSYISRFEINPGVYERIKHAIHSEVDKIYRNYASELVISEMKGLPLKINGRGWEQFGKNKSKFHEFNEFGEVQHGEYQFQSLFGIIDVVPFCFGMHDRTSRAMAYKSGFLCNANLDFKDSDGGKYDDIFFTGINGSLRSLADRVVSNPRRHIMRCNEIGEICKRIEPFDYFFNFLVKEAGCIN